MAITITAKNLTGSALTLDTLGVAGNEIPASSQIVLTNGNTIDEIHNNAELQAHIVAGDAVLIVGNNQLSQEQSLSVSATLVSLKEIDLFLSVYEAGTTAIGATATTVVFDTVKIESDNDFFTLAAGEVTVTQAGIYRLTYSASFTTNSGTRSEMVCLLELNTVEIVGTKQYTYHRNSTQNNASTSTSSILQLDASDVIRMRVAHNSGATTGGSTIANTCELTLEYISSVQD